MRARPPNHLEALTERIIGAAFQVSNTLGHGFLESVYRKALVCELKAEGLDAKQEVPFQLSYRGEQIGAYVADLVVENSVIVELKAAEALSAAHRSQVINYLKASGLPLGLLFDFGVPRLEIRRVLP
jgi:GxxExxY protein